MALSELPPPLLEESGAESPRIRATPPGPQSRSATTRLESVECPAFGRRRSVRAEASGTDPGPIVLAHGLGSNLFDVDGNRYVDLAAGFGSMLLGHGAPSVTRAIEAQCERLVQGLGDVYASDVKVALLERLSALHPGESPQVLLAQSGGDAVTAALKTAALSTGKPGIVAFEGGYHGLGYAPLAACGLRPSYREPFAAQLNPHVAFAPFPRDAAGLDSSLTALEAALRNGIVGAVLVEPVLGRGGCVVPPDAFVKSLCDLAHRHGALVIADEVWTGLGRTGSIARTTAIGATPDILCFGKGLGGGLSIAACVAPASIMGAWAKGDEVVHTATHTGSPLTCAAAVATLDSIRFRQLAARSTEVGGRFKAQLARELAAASGVIEVRGEGLMIGVELADGAQATAVVRRMLTRGYIVLSGGMRGEVITMTPPLTIAETLLDGAASALREAIAG